MSVFKWKTKKYNNSKITENYRNNLLCLSGFHFKALDEISCLNPKAKLYAMKGQHILYLFNYNNEDFGNAFRRTTV